MNRTIHIRGTGKAELKPDRVELPMTLTARNIDYEQTMELAAKALEALLAAFSGAGFEREIVKTLDYRVDPVFESEQDDRGVYRQVFSGYECRHTLKAAFPLSQERLGAALQALASCPARPVFNVRFTIKDQDAVREDLLKSAAEDARRKAEILCAVGGVTLGRLIHIGYQCSDGAFYSESNVMLAKASRAMPAMAALDIAPDTISVSDSASFLWEIL